MKVKNDILNKLVENATRIWADIESGRDVKIKVLDHVSMRLAAMGNPMEENKAKIEIVRRTCRSLRQNYPGYSNDIDNIIDTFEHHLKFDHIAVLPFKQLDALSYKIFMNQSMLSFVG